MCNRLNALAFKDINDLESTRVSHNWTNDTSRVHVLQERIVGRKVEDFHKTYFLLRFNFTGRFGGKYFLFIIVLNIP